MTEPSLKQVISSAMKTALKAGEKQRLGAIRLILAEFKRIEVDERIELDDDRALVIMDKMLKQRRDSLRQYESAGRDDLAAQEAFEIDVIQHFLPAELTAPELASLIQAAISSSDASSMRDMGKVMAILKPQVQGRADMGAVSAQIKQTLAQNS
jgi:uncharacterized protein YqeY